MNVDNETDPVQNIGIKEKIIELPVITRNSISENLIAYPVPSSDNVVLAWSYNFKEARSLSIVDMQGKLMKTQKISPAETEVHEVEIDIQDLPSGIYFVNLRSNEQLQFVRIIKI